MGKKLVTRTASILSETKKSKDKEAVAIAYEHIPRNPKEQEHGSLYAVIELEDAGGHAEEIAEAIIDVFHKEYYFDTDREPLQSFEAALGKINEELADRSGNGQINWLGKLNAVLAVLSQANLHVTQAGKAEAYLYRGEHEMHITEDLAGDSVNPLRTFINVASGDLTEKDRIAITTPGVFYKISKSELKKFGTESSPKAAAENLSKILAGENGSQTPNAVLFLEMVSPESYAVEPEPEKSAEVWIKEEEKPMAKASEKSIKGAGKAIDVLSKAASGLSIFVTEKAIPVVKTNVKKLQNTFKKEEDAERIIIESEEKIAPKEAAADEISNLEFDSEAGILEKPVETTEVPKGEIRIKEQKPKRISLERFNFSGLDNIKESFTKRAKKIKLPGGRYANIYLIAAIVLLLCLGGYFIVSNMNRTQSVAGANIFNQAKEKYETALTEIQGGDKEKAAEDLTIAEKLANDAKNEGYNKDEVNTLLSNITGTKDEAFGIVRNSAKVFADFGKGELDGLFTDGAVFYGINYNDGSVYALDPIAKTVATVIAKPRIKGKIEFATFISERKVIVAYTDEKVLYEIDLTAKKSTEQTVSGGLEDAVAMSSFFSNIYLLSPSDNQIYKHFNTTFGYGKKTPYAPDATAGEFTKATDLAIDSDIYTISTDGVIRKYTAGQEQNYKVTGVPEKLTDVPHIYAASDVKGQYLYNGSKVVQINENGKFIAQYISDDVNAIKMVTVNDKKNTIYILSGGKIYQVVF